MLEVAMLDRFVSASVAPYARFSFALRGLYVSTLTSAPVVTLSSLTGLHNRSYAYANAALEETSALLKVAVESLGADESVVGALTMAVAAQISADIRHVGGLAKRYRLASPMASSGGDRRAVLIDALLKGTFFAAQSAKRWKSESHIKAIFRQTLLVSRNEEFIKRSGQTRFVARYYGTNGKDDVRFSLSGGNGLPSYSDIKSSISYPNSHYLVESEGS